MMYGIKLSQDQVFSQCQTSLPYIWKQIQTQRQTTKFRLKVT
jgi:hypothetical protein